MRAAVEHGSRRRARTCGLTIFQSLYFVHSPYIFNWKMGVVASATTRFSWVRKRFLSGMWPGVIHTLGAARCPGRLSSGVPLGTLRRLAVLHPLRRNAECSPRWCLSSGGLLSLCPPLCLSWPLSFFLGTVFLGFVWSFISSSAAPRVLSSPRQWRATLRLKWWG